MAWTAVALVTFTDLFCIVPAALATVGLSCAGLASLVFIELSDEDAAVAIALIVEAGLGWAGLAVLIVTTSWSRTVPLGVSPGLSLADPAVLLAPAVTVVCWAEPAMLVVLVLPVPVA